MKEGPKNPVDPFLLMVKDENTIQIILNDQESSTLQCIFKKVGQKTIMRANSETGKILSLEGNLDEMKEAKREINYLLNRRPYVIHLH